MTLQRAIIGNPIAASLAAADTRACLAELERLAPSIGLAEVRLDLMETFDVEPLVAKSPVPLILTCRPRRERGKYDGPEEERLAILRHAYECEVAYVDIEVDCLDAIASWHGSPTRLIGSQHWYDSMPHDLTEVYLGLRDRCDVVKLAGMAVTPQDVVHLFEFMRAATTPVIGIAMGEFGACTRLLSPTFERSLLTFGAASADAVTAPGQFTVGEMAQVYQLHLVDAGTKAYLHIVSTDRQHDAVVARQAAAADGAELHVSLRIPQGQSAAALADAIRAALPRVEVEVAT
jgi:3-dehydroquinate dehydratase type I